MSTGTVAPEKETVTERADPESIFAVALGAVVIFAGSIVLFSASPAIPADPLFGVSSGPVSVITNMILGASIGAAGVMVMIPSLDDLLKLFSS